MQDQVLIIEIIYQYTNDYLSNTFQSNISLRKKWANTPFNLSSNLRHSQNTQKKIINLSVPEISLNMNRIFPFKQTSFKKPLVRKNWFKIYYERKK